MTWPLVAGEGDARRNSETVYSSPDGSFQFDYPNLLVDCHLSANSGWEPQESCQATLAVCDEGEVVCLAYPAEKLEGASVRAAAFWISPPVSAKSESECFLSLEEPSAASNSRTEVIHGLRFRIRDWADAGMSHSRQTFVFGTYHQGICYAMGVTYSSVSAASFDSADGPKELTRQQRAAIDKQLRRPIETFRFAR